MPSKQQLTEVQPACAALWEGICLQCIALGKDARAKASVMVCRKAKSSYTSNLPSFLQSSYLDSSSSEEEEAEKEMGVKEEVDAEEAVMECIDR